MQKWYGLNFTVHAHFGKIGYSHIRIERMLVPTFLMLPAAAADCVEKRLWMHSGRKEWCECVVLLSGSL